jgi:hypothetical protein
MVNHGVYQPPVMFLLNQITEKYFNLVPNITSFKLFVQSNMVWGLGYLRIRKGPCAAVDAWIPSMWGVILT